MANKVVIGFRGFVDRPVRLWFKDSLQSPEWNLLQTIPALPGATVREAEDAWDAGQAERFYRLSSQ